MKNSLLIFGTKNFNNSLKEIKEYLNFSLVFFDNDTFSELSLTTINSVLVEADSCIDKNYLQHILKIKNKPILLFKKSNSYMPNKFFYDSEIMFPLTLVEISNIIINLITIKKFKQNSSVKIKGYEIDKNERKLKKESLSITITEREIQLIELLNNETKPISKNIILKKVWKYSDDTDTHTIETHIYRLRKKILNKFKDEHFISKTKTGYTI